MKKAVKIGLVLVIAMMIIALSFVFSALGATTFNASMSPSARYVGQTGTVTFAISYTTPSADIQALQITLPTGFSSASSVSGTCNSKSWTLDSSNPIKLSNHNSGNSGVFQSGSGRTLAVTFTATPPTSSGSYGFTTLVYSDNGYSTNTGSANQPTFTVSYVPITITSSPATGSGFITIDGSAKSTPYSPSNWVVGDSTHTISASTTVGTAGTRYVYSGWSDSGAQSHGITVPSTSTTYTANFNTQCLLTIATNGVSSIYPTHVFIAGISSGTAYDGLPYSQWFASTASSGTIGVDTTVNGATGTQYVFTKWDADSSTANPRASVTMSSPITYISDYKTQYSITASAGLNGAINPNGQVWTDSTADKIFTITPNSHYHVADVLVDETSIGPATTYTFHSLNGAHTISASFAIDTYKITSSAGLNGAISPLGDTYVNWNTNQPFTITANANYHVVDVLVDTVSQGPITSYTFNNVVATHTISASFALDTYAITPSVVGGANGHGSISPNSVQTVNYGSTPTFTFNPDTGYSASAVTVDDSGVSFSNNQYQFSAVSAAHSIAVTFTANPVTLTLTPGTGGSIDANPSSGWHYGDVVTVTANPSTGYSFGSWGGALSGSNNPTTITMSGDKTVTATFTQDEYTIGVIVNPSSSAGTVTPDKSAPYHYGDIVTFTASANSGYDFSAWSGAGTTTVDGKRQITVSESTSVTADFLAQVTSTWVSVSCSQEKVDKSGSMQTTVSGKLTLSNDHNMGVAGKPVSLKYYDGAAWQDVTNEQINTDSDGSYSYVWTVPGSISVGPHIVKAVFAGDQSGSVPQYTGIQAETNGNEQGGGLFVIPEYVLGALAALAACFIGFVAFKKLSSLTHFKRIE